MSWHSGCATRTHPLHGPQGDEGSIGADDAAPSTHIIREGRDQHLAPTAGMRECDRSVTRLFAICLIRLNWLRWAPDIVACPVGAAFGSTRNDAFASLDG